MKRKYTEKYEKTRNVKNNDNSLKNIFHVEKEIKNIMIKFYLKIIKKRILIILNECN